ncbi:MAG: hypothetical protein M1588_04435 [Planctomycetes bacterium]|nr:hypothetical protein [Planctomycetota bacterium]
MLDGGTKRWAVEIQLTSKPSPDMTGRLQKTTDLIGAERHVLVCRSARTIETDRLLVVNVPNWLQRLVEA